MPHEEVSLKVLSEEVCETLADAAKLKGVFWKSSAKMAL